MKKTIFRLLAFTLCIGTFLLHTQSGFAEKDAEKGQAKKLNTLSYIKQVNAPQVWKETDAEGHVVKGKGIKIAIIDSGFDPKHPDFVGVKWSGYDYVQKSESLIDLIGHGTHVAGICKRMVPEANFLFYRVLENMIDFTPHILGLNICTAMEQAIEDGADVINLSLLCNTFNHVDIFKRVIEKATKKGIVVVVGAGNNGPCKGTMFSILANNTNVISVGACSRVISLPTLQVEEGEIMETVPATMVSPMFPIRGSFSVLDLGKPTEIDKGEAKGKILLVTRSPKLNAQFLEEARSAGAIGVVGINDTRGEWYGEQNIFLFDQGEKKKKKLAPFVTVSGCFGKVLRQQLQESKQVKVSSVKKERMAPFSSSGPSPVTLKQPDVVAPGQDIYSSVPFKIDKKGHQMQSGTSMATPVVSGAAALLKQVHPDWTPEQIKAALANNAITLKTSENVRAPYLQQGAGRIDVLKAVRTQTFLTPSQVRFGNIKSKGNKKENNEVRRTLYIQNSSEEDKTYHLKVEGGKWKSHFQLECPSCVTVKAGSKKGVPLSLKVLPNPPEGAYTGSVMVQDGKQKLKIPFTVFVDWKNKKNILFL